MFLSGLQGRSREPQGRSPPQPKLHGLPDRRLLHGHGARCLSHHGAGSGVLRVQESLPRGHEKDVSGGEGILEKILLLLCIPSSTCEEEYEGIFLSFIPNEWLPNISIYTCLLILHDFPANTQVPKRRRKKMF